MMVGVLLCSAVLATGHVSLPQLQPALLSTSVVEDRQKAVIESPDDPEARLKLGIAYADIEEYDLAMAELVESIRLNPDNARSLNAYANFQLGMILAALERPALAVNAYREALRLGFKSPSVHSALGEALTAQRKFDEAIAEYRAALVLDPDSFAAHAGLALSLEASGSPEEALTEYETALQVAPPADEHVVAAITQRLKILKDRRQL
jgi:tetratricopeptide (TPR) repeat protein